MCVSDCISAYSISLMHAHPKLISQAQDHFDRGSQAVFKIRVKL